MSKNNAPSVYAEISRIYHDPAASSLVPPLAKIDFLFDNGSLATTFLPPDQLTASGLKKAVPRLRGLPAIRPLVRELNTQLADIMDGAVSDHEISSGLLLPHTGLQRLPAGHSLYVLGYRARRSGRAWRTACHPGLRSRGTASPVCRVQIPV